MLTKRPPSVDSGLNVGRLFSTELEVVPGGLALPETPGLGVELNEEAVARFSVDGWA